MRKKLYILLTCVLSVVFLSCDTSEEDFQKAQEEHSVQAYSTFLSKHHKGDLAEEARDSVISIYSRVENINDIPNSHEDSDLEQRLWNLIEDRSSEEYNKAASENSIEAWEHFLNIVPERYQEDGDNRLLAAREDLLWQNESSAWEVATERNTVQTMQKYINLYPNGRHVAQAEKKMIDLEVDAAFAGEHGELPPLERGYSSGKAYSTIEITNNTQYELTINYSGIESKRMVIPAHNRKSIHLKNGHYRLAASVGHNVRPFAGQEYLDGSDYSSTFYIITSRY